MVESCQPWVVPRSCSVKKWYIWCLCGDITGHSRLNEIKGSIQLGMCLGMQVIKNCRMTRILLKFVTNKEMPGKREYMTNLKHEWWEV